jgi:hypothetical protein
MSKRGTDRPEDQLDDETKRKLIPATATTPKKLLEGVTDVKSRFFGHPTGLKINS